MAPKKKRKGKGKAKDTRKINPKDKERGKKKAKDEGKAKGEENAKKKTAPKDKAKGKEKAERKLKTEAKGKLKQKKKAKGKAKTKAAKKPKGKKKGKAKDLGKAKVKTQVKTIEGPATQPSPPHEPAVLIGSASEKRRWERVTNRLGLEKHVHAISQWDGGGDPPILTGFSFVRHVESAARDLRCAGTAVTMTQGIVIQREDGERFLVGRGVAQKYLGLQVPHKDRANAGQRFLSLQEREALGQSLG